MLHKPLVSVLLAVYNTPFELVKRAIISVLNQDFQNFELIIIDDGSDDEYRFELSEYVVLFPNVITYIFHANCGQAESINKAILLSKGDYITIIDADDEFKPDHLQKCLEQMTHSDLIASTTHTVVDAEDDYYIPDRMDKSKVIHVDDCILFATLFGKKEVFLNNKFYNMYSSDANFYERVSQKYIVKKVNLRTYIYYRNIPNSTCAKLKNTMLQASA
ncbi:MAG: glycosyltransferase family 2 protein [Bacteroidota bacterium]|jgi:glycosyltransferase involved in cell wall biosynthesis